MKILNPLKYYWPHKGYKYLYYAILLIYVLFFIGHIQKFTNTNFPLIRYFVASLSLYYILIGVYLTYSTVNYKGLISVAFFVFFWWVLYSIGIGLPASFSPTTNYIGFKRLISGQLLLFLLPLLVFSNPNLYLIKRLFQLSYFLMII